MGPLTQPERPGRPGRYLAGDELNEDGFVAPDLPLVNMPRTPASASEALRAELAERGRTDLYFFCTVILGYDRLTPHTHMPLCRFIETCRVNRRKIYYPRGHFKTTIFTIGRTIQDIINNPNIRILIVASTSRNAERFLIEIEKHFESNELLRWLYPDVCWADPRNEARRWNSQEMEVRRTAFWREPTVDTIGAKGNVESRHYDVIRADDLIGRREYESDEEMSKTCAWTDGLEALLIDPTCQIDVIGSKWRMDDVYAYIEHFYSHDEPPVPIGPWAYMRGELAIFGRSDIEDGAPIFPERFSLAYLNRLRDRTPEFYAAQYAGNPIAPGLSVFRDEWWHTAVQEGNEIVCYGPGDRELFRTNVWDLHRFGLFDPAVSKNKRKNARNAMLAVGWTDLGRRGKFIFILESRIGHYSPTDAVNNLFEMNDRWRLEFFSVESVAYQAAIKFWVEDRCDREFLPYPSIVEYIPESDVVKDERIKGLQPFFRAGMVWAVGEHPELKEEFIFFPRAAFRDGLDALAQGNRYWGGVMDAEREAAMREREARLLGQLDVTGYGLVEPPEWDEDAWLRELDSSGYGTNSDDGGRR